MKGKIAVITALALGAFVIAGVAGAAAHRRARLDDPCPAEHFIARASRHLALSSEQEARLEEIAREIDPLLRELRAMREKIREDLKGQLGSERLDAPALKSAARDNLDKVRKALDLGIDRLTEFHATLTPEQRAEVAERLGRMDHWRDRPGGGRWCGCGPERDRGHGPARD